METPVEDVFARDKAFFRRFTARILTRSCMPKEYGTVLEAEDGREVLLNSSTQEGNRVVDVTNREKKSSVVASNSSERARR